MPRAKKKRASTGCLFWIAIFLLIVFLFLSQKDKIADLVKSKQFKDFINKKPNLITKLNTRTSPINQNKSIPETEQNNKQEIKPEEPVEIIQFIEPQQEKSQQPEITQNTNKDIQKIDPTPDLTEQEKTRVKENVQEKIKPEKTVNAKTRLSNLWYAYLENEKIRLKVIKREIQYVNAPLSRTLDSLINGINNREQNNGCINLIPRGTRLLTAKIINGTAVLNFSDDFQYNSYGKEGFYTQLGQIVMTATEFSNVKKVKFLINNQAKTYIGGEGVRIDQTFSRNSFQQRTSSYN